MKTSAVAKRKKPGVAEFIVIRSDIYWTGKGFSAQPSEAKRFESAEDADGELPKAGDAKVVAI